MNCPFLKTNDSSIIISCQLQHVYGMDMGSCLLCSKKLITLQTWFCQIIYFSVYSICTDNTIHLGGVWEDL